MVFNQFAAGRKVYGGGSYAPTRGQVNPQGYIQREVKKRNQQALAKNGGVSQVGNDGQSDTRSGVAKNMLDNRGRQAVVRRQPQAVVRSSGGGNSNVRQPAGNRSGNSGNSSVAPVSTAGAQVAPTVPITPTGQLELPYGSEFANQVLDAQMSYDADIATLQQEEQANEQAYAANNRDLEKGYVEQKRGTLNNNAAAGTAFSSAYGVGVNEDSNNYLNAKNDLTAGYNNFKSAATSRRNQAATALNTFIQRAMQGYADSLAGDAGSLGYGTDGGAGASPVGASAPATWDSGSVRGTGWGTVKVPPKNKNKNNNGGGGGGGHKPQAVVKSQAEVKADKKKGKKK